MSLMMAVDQLNEGDCFLYDSPESAEQAQSQIDRINEVLREAGEDPITPRDAREFAGSHAEQHVLYAVVRATGHRVSQKVTDGRRFIWHRPVTVECVEKRDEFERMIESMKALRKRMDKVLAEANKVRAKSRKQAKREAEAERTH